MNSKRWDLSTFMFKMSIRTEGQQGWHGDDNPNQTLARPAGSSTRQLSLLLMPPPPKARLWEGAGRRSWLRWRSSEKTQSRSERWAWTNADLVRRCKSCSVCFLINPETSCQSAVRQIGQLAQSNCPPAREQTSQSAPLTSAALPRPEDKPTRHEY